MHGNNLQFQGFWLIFVVGELLGNFISDAADELHKIRATILTWDSCFIFHYIETLNTR